MLDAIVDEGSLRRAADRLHVSQPALSRQLQALERTLGGPVFLRVKGRMKLTPAGERLLASARAILLQVEDSERAFRGSDLLRLSTECNTCYHWLPARIRALQEEFSGLEVRVVMEATPQPMPFLFDGKIDLAIVSSPISDSRVELAPLFEDELVLVVGKESPLAKRTWVNPEDFADQHLLVYNWPLEANKVFRDVLSPAGVRPKQVTQLPLTEAMIEMAKSGMGVAVLARWAIAREMKTGAVVGIPIRRRGFKRRWSAAWLKVKSPPRHVLRFVSLLGRQPFA